MIVRCMRNFVLVALAWAQVCIAAESSERDKAIGLWQFPDRGVWILVNPDGSTFQCRHAPSGRLFTSKGRFVEPHAIEWEEIWGADQISFADGGLILAGQWGVFSYRKAKDPMYERCLANQQQ